MSDMKSFFPGTNENVRSFGLGYGHLKRNRNIKLE